MVAQNQSIQVFQFYDYFSLPQPEKEGECIYFKFDDEVYAALEKVSSLPIKSIIERINIDKFYKGYPQAYFRWKLDKEKERLYLVTSENGPYTTDYCTQIYIPDFKWASIMYNDIYNGIEFVFTTENENDFTVIFTLDDYVRFVVDEVRPHEKLEMDLKTLEEIYHLLHFDGYTWYEKSMLIHKMVLGENCDLRKCSKDRPDKVTRWMEKLKIKDWEPIEDFGSEPCNCYGYTLEYWVHRESIFLSKAVLYLIQSKKASFSAKAIMMFIIFHSFNSQADSNKTKGCIRSYGRDLYNAAENGLNELVKLRWLEMKEYQDLKICEWQCEQLGYHNCIDEHYNFTSEFSKLVGWRLRSL